MVQSEPADLATCRDGGAIQKIGYDINYNGMLESSEVIQEIPLCDNVVYGSIFVRSQEQLDSLEQVYRVEGSIVLDCYFSALNDFSPLQELEYIGGSLVFTYCDFFVDSNVLQSLHTIEENFVLHRVRNLVELDHMPLDNLGGLSILGTSSLLSMNGFSNIHSLSNDLSFFRQFQDFPVDYSGFSNLESIGGDFNIVDTSSLHSFDDFDSLTHIGGTLQLELMNDLSDISGLYQLTSVGDIWIGHMSGAKTCLDDWLEFESSTGISLPQDVLDNLSICLP